MLGIFGDAFSGGDDDSVALLNQVLVKIEVMKSNIDVKLDSIVNEISLLKNELKTRKQSIQHNDSLHVNEIQD